MWTKCPVLVGTDEVISQVTSEESLAAAETRDGYKVKETNLLSSLLSSFDCRSILSHLLLPLLSLYSSKTFSVFSLQKLDLVQHFATLPQTLFTPKQ